MTAAAGSAEAPQETFDWAAWSKRAAFEYGQMAPWQITEEKFHDLLGCMPPARHRVRVQYEWFYLIELLSGSTAMWVARVGTWETPLYVCFQDDMLLNDAALVEILDKALVDHAAGVLPTEKPKYVA